MFTNLDEVVLGARYKEVITDFVGICTSKSECLTGCDRVTLEGAAGEGGKSEYMSCDITCLEYVDKGVSDRFTEIKTPVKEVAKAKPGAPAVRGTRSGRE